MTDFETLILNQIQDQMQHMYFQFSPLGKEKKYNELEKTKKYVVDTYIRNIHENVDKLKRSPKLQQKLIEVYNKTFNKYGLEYGVE